MLAALMLSSCASEPSRSPAQVETRDVLIGQSSVDESIEVEAPNLESRGLEVEDLNVSRGEYYEQQAQSGGSADRRIDNALNAAEYYIQGQDFESAERAVSGLYQAGLNQVQADRLTVVNAYAANARGEHARVISLLRPIWMRAAIPEERLTSENDSESDSQYPNEKPRRPQLSTQQVDALLLASFSYQALDDYDAAIAALIQRERSLVGPARSETTRYLWQIINSLSEQRRLLLIDNTQNRLVRNRVEQSLGSQVGAVQDSPQQFSQWREEQDSSEKQRLVSEWSASSPRSIAVLLPITSKFNTAAIALQDGINYQHQQNQSPYRPQLRFYDIGDQAYQTPQYYTAALQSGADFIIGPLGMDYANSISNYGGQRLPTLLLGGDAPLNMMTSRLSLSPEQEGRTVAERAWRDGHLSAAILTADSRTNQRMVEAFQQRWLSLGGKISGTMTYSPQQYDHSVELKQLFSVNQSQYRYSQISNTLGFKPKFSAYQRADIDFIFMLANNETGRLVRPQINFFTGSKIPVYSSSAVFNGIRDVVENVDLNDTRFPAMPWEIQSIDIAPYAGQLNRLFALGSDAYSLAGGYSKLSSNPELAISGRTGDISIGARGEAIIQPIWARFRAGDVVTDELMELDINAVRSLNGRSRSNRNVKGNYNGSNSKTYDASSWNPSTAKPKGSEPEN